MGLDEKTPKKIQVSFKDDADQDEIKKQISETEPTSQPEASPLADESVSSSSKTEVVASSNKSSTKWWKRKKTIVAFSLFAALVLGNTVYWLGEKDNYVETRDSQSQKSATPDVDKKVEAKKFGVAVGLLEGNVERSDDGKEWSVLKMADDLGEGDQVRTSSNGRTVLLIDDGSVVRLGKSSSVTLKSLAVDDVVIENTSGEVYTRVVASTSRKFSVLVGSEKYIAKGTAYRTTNTVGKKGVEVFHSIVQVESKTTDVSEGNAFFALSDVKAKENTISALDIEALKSDEFIKWNSDQDKKVAEFSDKLGVLVEIDKPKATPVPTTTTTSTKGIVLSSSVVEYSAKFSWQVTGIDVSKGYKLVKSSKTQSPVYPADSAAYVEPGKTSYTLYLGDGKTYYFRICAYREGSCESYSNTVTVTTPKKEEAEVVTGDVTLSISGNTANWTFLGTAPHGFKLVMSKAMSPTYPDDSKAYISSGTSVAIPTEGLTSGDTYYVRVCKYTSSACVDYSNEVTYIIP